MQPFRYCYVVAALASALVYSPTGAVAAEASPQEQNCSQELVVLSNQWDAAGLPSPAKPGQSRVNGRSGHTHTSGEISFMREQLGKAARACEGGNEHEAMLRMDAVRAIMKFAEVAHPASHNYQRPAG